jgi:fructoselysine/glucoselysine PTS system EIIA component
MDKKITARKFMIATHGAFAEGIRSSLDIIIGKTENVFLIQAYLDENKSIEEELSVLIKDGQGEEWIIFTDLLGGSINNQVLRYAAGRSAGPSGAKIHIVAGFNLPLLIEVLLSDPEGPAEEIIEDAVTKAREQMVYVNKLIAIPNNQSKND